MRSSNPLYKGFAWYGQFNEADNSSSFVRYSGKTSHLRSERNYKKYVDEIRKKRAITKKEKDV